MSNLCTGVKSNRRRAAFLGLLVAISPAAGSLATQAMPFTPAPPATPAQPSTPPTVEEAVGGLGYDALAANLELEGAGAGVAQRLAAPDPTRARYLPALGFSRR